MILSCNIVEPVILEKGRRDVIDWQTADIESIISSGK